MATDRSADSWVRREPLRSLWRALLSTTRWSRRLVAWPGLAWRFGRIPDDGRLRIVTGADSSHLRSLCELLESLAMHEPDADVVVWDLGLSQDQRSEIERRHPDHRLETFDFAAHPPHFDITRNAGEYAWKPVIIDVEVRGSDDLVVWLDAGCIVTAPLRWFRRYIRALGIYSPYSSGTLRMWTHPGTLDALDVPETLLDRLNFAGGVVGIDPHDPAAVALVASWAEYAHDRDCIAPAGSNRRNHRQDQAVLSVLLHQNGLGASGDFRALEVNRLAVEVHRQHRSRSTPPDAS